MKRTQQRIAFGFLFLFSPWLMVCANDSDKGNEMGHSNETSTAVAEKPAKHKHTNLLSKETSPYLLQHQHNPVHWHAWNDEALALARKLNKPIFLSIGYSACHWCHVMERESFENEETAAVMNEHFICIKVDREERPDIDNIYMTAVQMMTGSGGWPLNVFLTPDLKPFYGGTYWPPESKFGRPAFRTILENVAKAWREKPDDLTNSADRLTQAILKNTAAPPGKGELDKEMLTRAAAHFRGTFDSLYGGFGRAPKFPPSGTIALLLRHHHQSGDKEALKMATLTLDRMAYGGMYDQLGGGFHRYSVDPYWLTPHFEKMLYDNALLSRVYLEAWQVTKNDHYRRVATETLDYILRDMTDPRGGFHSSEDADSEGVEGKFYVWTPAEIDKLLGEKDGAFFSKHYNVTEKGNFEEHNILNVPLKTDVAREAAEKRLAPLRAKLLAARAKRIRPGKDDKVLASWNGMMISALARGYQVLDDERYLKAAERAAEFILSDMVRDGVLLRTWRGVGGPSGQGEAKLPAYLDDYAQMAAALTDLYEATFELKWLEEADRLLQKAVADFWDEENGAFFDTGAIHKHLLVRTKSFYDGAEPSGNAVATLTLLRLAKLLDKPEYAKKAETILSITSRQLQGQPRAHTYLLCAVDFLQQPTREIALAGKKQSAQTKELLRTIHQRFIPNKVLALIEPNTPCAEKAERRIPLLKNKELLAGKATAYVCENYACKQPVNDPTALAAALR